MPDSKDVKSLQAVVVTANVYGGVKKIDAGYNVVVADRQQITDANPEEHRRPVEDLAGNLARVQQARPEPTSKSPAFRAAAMRRSSP